MGSDRSQPARLACDRLGAAESTGGDLVSVNVAVVQRPSFLYCTQHQGTRLRVDLGRLRKYGTIHPPLLTVSMLFPSRRAKRKP